MTYRNRPLQLCTTNVSCGRGWTAAHFGQSNSQYLGPRNPFNFLLFFLAGLGQFRKSELTLPKASLALRLLHESVLLAQTAQNYEGDWLSCLMQRNGQPSKHFPRCPEAGGPAGAWHTWSRSVCARTLAGWHFLRPADFLWIVERRGSPAGDGRRFALRGLTGVVGELFSLSLKASWRLHLLAELPDHPPRLFMWRNVRHCAATADGPERIHGEWWVSDKDIQSSQPYGLPACRTIGAE